MMYKKSNQSGALIIIAIIILTTLAVFSVAVVSYYVYSSRTGTTQLDAGKALDVADSGLADAKWRLLQPTIANQITCSAVTGNVNLTNTSFGDGEFTVTGTSVFLNKQATSVTLAQSINDSTNIIPVSSILDLPTASEVILDSEVINYTGVSSSDSLCGGNAPCLTGATRGYRSSTAASHVASIPLYLAPSIVLSSSISSSSTIVPVNTIVGIPTTGRISIDREEIDYSGTSNSSSVCSGSQPCIFGAVRGVNGTDAAAHTSATPLASYHCSLESTGGVPSQTNPLGRRVVSQGLLQSYAMFVGSRRGNNYSLFSWNFPNENQWNDVSINEPSRRNHLRSVSMLNVANGWAVGDDQNSAFSILRYNPSIMSWQISTGIPTPPAASVRDLDGVSAVSEQDAWAVGQRKGTNPRRYTVLHWDGSDWCLLPTSGNSCGGYTVPSNQTKNLFSVSMLDSTGTGTANLGFAVGGGGRILKYQSNTWSQDTSGTTNTLRGVKLVSTTKAFAVGNNGTIRRWDGSSWVSVASPTTATLRGVDYDKTVDEGFAVGSSGTILRIYKIGAFYAGQLMTSNTTRTLYSVRMLSTKDAWAVGASGTILHWDGNTWTAVSNNGYTSTIYGVDAIATGSTPQFGWQEQFG